MPQLVLTFDVSEGWMESKQWLTLNRHHDEERSFERQRPSRVDTSRILRYCVANITILSRTNSFAAGWLNLLFTLSKSPQFRTIKRDTEHLPVDVSAVPALGTVEAIVKLAAISGCDSVEISASNGYPVVHGYSSQLSFREHPHLGTICVYQQFPRAPTYRT
jgi:hypothetical protein